MAIFQTWSIIAVRFNLSRWPVLRKRRWRAFAANAAAVSWTRRRPGQLSRSQSLLDASVSFLGCSQGLVEAVSAVSHHLQTLSSSPLSSSRACGARGVGAARSGSRPRKGALGPHDPLESFQTLSERGMKEKTIETICTERAGCIPPALVVRTHFG